MKYCSKCGNQLFDEAVICPQCGCATGYQEHTIRKQTSTMQTVAKIFMIIGTVINGFAIIPLAWCVPMTLSYINKIKNGERVGTGFKVCTLLFVNTIAGILMLCDDDN
jgi:uncharacterized membrane protein YvbJ